jgi:hypothetical protein
VVEVKELPLLHFILLGGHAGHKTIQFIPLIGFSEQCLAAPDVEARQLSMGPGSRSGVGKKLVNAVLGIPDV